MSLYQFENNGDECKLKDSCYLDSIELKSLEKSL